MRRDLLLTLSLLGALAGCPGDGAGIGDSCGGNDDCAGVLQCLNSRCVPRCERAPQCGDGYSCNAGLCVAAHGQAGDTCKSEVDCAAGLSCQINGAEVDSENRLVASCVAQNPMGHPAGAACDSDATCRNGTCELGHCVDLCRDMADCSIGSGCMTIPRVAVNGTLFSGCLPENSTLTWNIPVTSSSAEILLPIPTGGVSAALVMSVGDPGQKVGAQGVLDPCGCTKYTVPCPFLTGPNDPQTCTDIVAADEFYSQPPVSGGTGGSAVTGANNICGQPIMCNDGGPVVNHIRHLPAFGRSVLLMPSIASRGELKSGAYQIEVSSFWSDNSPGSAIPRVTAVVRIGAGAELPLHFFFLDLADHPCAVRTASTTLNAARAKSEDYFQHRYLDPLHKVFETAGIHVAAASYDDITGRHALDGIDVADVGSLLALGRYARGINVFFVRSLSPIGTEVFSPNPGPAGLGGTPESGIVIALDTLCYRDWPAMAQLTAHTLARYMGLYHNVEPRDPGQAPGAPRWQDLLPDSDLGEANLMYYSSRAGVELSPNQRDALSWSPVLQ